MKQLAWTAMIETGIPEIDLEHKYLFELYNRAIADEGSAQQEQLLVSLMDYALTHFAHEENLMMAVAYPAKNCTDHFKEHRDFIARLNALKSQPPYMVLDFIHEWLLRHILVSDFLVALHVKKLREETAQG